MSMCEEVVSHVLLWHRLQRVGISHILLSRSQEILLRLVVWNRRWSQRRHELALIVSSVDLLLVVKLRCVQIRVLSQLSE